MAAAYVASLLSTEDELVSTVRDPEVEQIDVRRVRLVTPEPEACSFFGARVYTPEPGQPLTGSK